MEKLSLFCIHLMLRHEIPHYKDKKHNNSAINTINTTTTTTATTTLLLLFLSKIKIIFLIKCILKMKLKLQVMRHLALHSAEFLFLLFFCFLFSTSQPDQIFREHF